MADVLQTVKAELPQAALLNANGGHGNVHAVARQKRELVHTGRLLFGRKLRPVTQRTRVVVTYCFPERDRAGRSQADKRRDAANWAPTSKCLIDGITASGIWPDDDDKWVEGPDNRIGAAHARSGFVEVWVTLEPIVEPAAPQQYDPASSKSKSSPGPGQMCGERVQRDLTVDGRLVGEVTYFCSDNVHDPKIRHRGMTEAGEIRW